MSFFNSSPTMPLDAALRRYWLMAIEPVVALLIFVAIPELPFARAVTALPMLLAGIYPSAIGPAPISYWLSACGAWFLSVVIVSAFT